MKRVLCLLVLMATAAPSLGVLGCGGSTESKTIPPTAKTLLVYYAMPG